MKKSLLFSVLNPVFTVLISWYLMQAIHEAGHVLHALLSGGTVQSVSLPLIGISCTYVSPNPQRLFVIWGGPLWGVLLPWGLWGLGKLVKLPTAITHRLRFFVGFCCLANGLYLGVGWLDRVGDAGDLLQEGVPAKGLILFGMVCSGLGFWVWHRLGEEIRQQFKREG